MEDGQNGSLMVAVVEPVGVVPKPVQEFATTRGPKTEVHNAAVLLAKMQSVTLKLAVSFRFDNYYLLDILRPISSFFSIYFKKLNLYYFHYLTQTPI